MYPAHSARWRWHVKAALASTISRAHDYGFAAALARGRKRPLVLGYHRVVDDFAAVARTEMPSMLTSTRMFERHLDCIGRHFRFVSLDEIGEHLPSGEPFDEPVAAITFDDGYRDNYEHAFPILKRKGIPAAVFVVTDLVGRPFWQMHDKLYHLVAKAFATWDDPRRELSGLLRALGLPTAPITREATRHAAADGLGPAAGPADDVGAQRDGRPRSERRQRVLQHSADARLARAPRDAPRRHHDRLAHEEATCRCRRNRADVVADELAGIAAGARSAARRADRALRVSRRAVQHRRSSRRSRAPATGSPTPPARTAIRSHRALTIERLLLWEGSSVDGDGEFSPAILHCQAHDLWPPARKCDRIHVPDGAAAHG